MCVLTCVCVFVSYICACVVYVWYVVVWSGLVWCGLVWSGVVWSGVVWSGVVWSGVIWSGLVWSGVVWSGVVWSGLVLYCMVWYDVVWYDVIWCGFCVHVSFAMFARLSVYTLVYYTSTFSHRSMSLAFPRLPFITAGLYSIYVGIYLQPLFPLFTR